LRHGTGFALVESMGMTGQISKLNQNSAYKMVTNVLAISLVLTCVLTQSVAISAKRYGFSDTLYSNLSENLLNSLESEKVGRFPAAETEEGEQSPFLVFMEQSKNSVDVELGLRAPAPLNEEQRANILNDHDNRISVEFTIPEDLRERTEFWFDIYTKYGTNHHVIHHSVYPWIIFKVVDVTEIMDGPENRWVKYHRAEKVVRHDRAEIFNTLIRLSKRKTYDNLSPLEKSLYDSLFVVNGPRKKVFHEAAINMRSQLGQKDFFIRGLQNSAKYIPTMEESFRQRGLPGELVRLPFVESSFNENAQSKVGASGVWQIMPYIGKHYVIMNNQIDERNNPIKATDVAANLLKQDYGHFRNWPLTVTAYNHGIGGVMKAVKATKSNYLPTIIKKYRGRAFGFASENYYTGFLAALYAEKYHNEVFGALYKEDLLMTDVFKLTRNMRVASILKATGLDKITLRNYNLDLKKSISRNAYLPRGYRLHLPLGYKTRLLSLLEEESVAKKTFRSASKRRRT
jgi:membrane-bound lytic murein transglycosylase D